MSRFGVLVFPLLSVFVSLAVSGSSADSFRQTVGPAVMISPAKPAPLQESAGRLIVVSWNVHVGNGDVEAVIDSISNSERTQGHGEPQFILLLEESVRQSPDIPSSTGFNVP